MTTFYTDSNRFFKKPNGLVDGRVVSLNKNEKRSALHFLKNFLNPSKAESDE